MTRRLVDACLMQARATDGLKESSVVASLNNVKHVDKWIDSQVRQYEDFKRRIQGYPNIRPRFAYVVKLYLKEPAE